MTKDKIAKKNEPSKKICKSDLINASTQIGLDASQAENLWEVLPQSSRSFSLPNVVYYFGAFIIFIALGWFMAKNYSLYGKKALIIISLAYSFCFCGVGIYFWKWLRNQKIGGLAIFLSLSLVPLIVYAVQDSLGLWLGNFPGNYVDYYAWIKGGWFLMEVCTISLTLVALYFFRFSLLTMLLYLTLWFLSMDIIPLICNSDSYSNYFLLQRVSSIGFGLSAILAAFFFSQKKSTNIFSYWGYFFGVISFWIGLTFLTYKSELVHLVYLIINIAMILVAPYLKKKIFLVFGLLGVLAYLVDIVYRHFSSSVLFPFILSLGGISIIILGFIFQRKRRIQA